jgi:hypothetical protein
VSGACWQAVTDMTRRHTRAEALPSGESDQWRWVFIDAFCGCTNATVPFCIVLNTQFQFTSFPKYCSLLITAAVK